MTVQKRRLWWGIAALVAVAVAVAVAVIVPIRLSQRSGVAPGTQVQVDDGIALKGLRTGSVRLPSGDLTITVTAPQTHFPADADPYGDAELDRVARSGRWVAVGWTLRSLQLPTAEALVLGRAPTQFQVALVTDGVRHDLAAGRTEDAYAATESRAGLAIAGRKLTLVDHKRVYVALPKAPASLSVEVTYEGLTQRWDPAGSVDSGIDSGVDSGVAAPLYRPGVSPRVPADPGLRLAAPGFGFLPGRRGHEDQVSLGLHPTPPLPYVPGLGWAKPGRTWLVVPVLTNLVDPFVFWPTPEVQAHALYRLTLTGTTVTLDGQRPARELPYHLQNPAATDSTTSAYYVWDVAAGSATQSLHLHQDYVSGPPDDESPSDAPAKATATADATLTLTR